jgi:hypothetical protein
MKKFIVLILVNLFFQQGLLANVEEKRKELIGVINEELVELNRLNKQIGARKPSLLLRMAELYLEKARLINEAENRAWLQMSPEERLRKDEKSYFNESRKNYINAQKTCYFMLKRFKNFKGKGEVYYILAFNAKEFQQQNRARDFFKKALKYSRPGSETNTKAKLALAEFYYNNKEYKKAEPLYVDALKKRGQRWWTKDAYNLSWCFFRNGKKQKAINLMNRVHALSGDSNYVDIRDMVERDLAYFYSASGQTKNAIDFYRKVGKNVSSNLLKVGKFLKSKAKYGPAEGALSEALKYSKDQRELAAIGVELLELYDRFGRVRDHLKVCEVLYELKKTNQLDERQIEKLKYHVAKMSALLQKQVVAKTYKSLKKIRNSKAKYATRYFELQAKLEGKTNQKSIFHAAETQYAIGSYDTAASLYDQSYMVALAKGDKKIVRLSLDGLMASLGGKGISQATTDKYLDKTYAAYLKENPKSKRSDKIYQRLFSEHHKKGDLENAEKVLNEYLFHFPRKHAQHEAMLGRIMDGYRKKGNKPKISYWVGKINSGDIKVTKAYAKKLRLVLLSMQFDKVQKFSTEGDKVSALRGYMEIFNSAGSSPDAKKNAAYNVAVLYHEMGNKTKTYEWVMLALGKMNGSDVKRYESSLLLIGTGLFDARETQKAAEVYEASLKKICKVRSKNKVAFYRNSSVLYLADGNIEKALELVKLGGKCGIPSNVKSEMSLDILDEAASQGRWSYVKTMVDVLEKQLKNSADLIYPAAKLRDVYLSRGRIGQAKKMDKKIKDLYQKAIVQRRKVPLEALDVIASYEVENLIDISKEIESQKLKFPEKSYNRALKKKFSLLDKLTTKAVKLFNIGSGVGMIHGYKILAESYQQMANEVTKFKPPGKAKEYIASFQKSMRSIASPIGNKAQDYRIEARNKIVNNKILSPYNYYFMGGDHLPIMPRFFSSQEGVVMDRGGKK